MKYINQYYLSLNYKLGILIMLWHKKNILFNDVFFSIKKQQTKFHFDDIILENNVFKIAETLLTLYNYVE